MGNSYVATKSTSNGGGFYRQYEHSYAPTFDSHTMVFETTSNYLNWGQSVEADPQHDGTVFLVMGNYQYGQLLHKRPKEYMLNMPNDVSSQTYCHPILQSNGVRCSNQNIRMVECGIAQTVLITIDNLVYGMYQSVIVALTCLVSGNNFFGQLGVNHLKTVYEPVRMDFSFDSQIVEVVLSQFHTLFLTVNGKVYVSGNNYYSQLCIDDNWVLTPTLIEDLGVIHHVYSGLRFTIFQTEDGTLLLNGDIEESNTPVNKKEIFKQDSSDPIRRVSCGDSHIIILTQSGKVFVYGRNYSGALGLGHLDDVFDEVQELKYQEILSIQAVIVDIQCGESHTIFKTRDGHTYGCGYNTKNQLGIPSETYGTSVQTITALNALDHTKNKITEVRCGRESTIYLTDKNEIFICGQLWKDECFQKAPTRFYHPIFEKKNICSMAVGGYHMIIYLEDKFIKDYHVEFEDENTQTTKLILENITSIESFIESIEKHSKPIKKKRTNIYYLIWNTNFNRFEFICNIRKVPTNCFIKRMTGTLAEVVAKIEPSYTDSYLSM